MKSSREGEVLFSSDQIIVKLKEKTAQAVTTNIPWKPLRYVSEPVSKFGTSPLDKLSKDLGVQSIRRVAKPTFVFSQEAGVVREEPDPFGLHRTFVMRLGKGMDVAAAVKALAKDRNVEAVELNYLAWASIVPNDPLYPQQWGLPRMNCPDAWDRNTGCSSVRVAVVDSGADLNHPDLAANLINGFDFVDAGAPPPGWHWEGDFTGRDPTPEDDNGHGTHVAGTIAAATDNGLGVAGVAWRCGLMPVRALARLVRDADEYVTGSGSYADIADGIVWAADQGAHVISMSLGGPSSSFVLENAINYAFGKNCVLVAAMGNDNTSAPSYPAAYGNVLAVGATDITDTRAGFSNFGPHIDVVAPGVNILSTVPGGGYGSMNGTSMAAPHVSGLAALLKCCKMNFSNTQIIDIIRSTARPLGGSSPNDYYGHGIVDAKEALGKCPVIVGPIIDGLCRRYPWLPWCRPPFDLCKRFPWLCRPFPFPLPRLPLPPLPLPPIPQPRPGPLPPGPLEYGEGTPQEHAGYAEAYLSETERELKRALKMVRKLRRGEDVSRLGEADEGDCGCSEK